MINNDITFLGHMCFEHFKGISDQEFNYDLINGLKNLGYNLSADMQSFVRQVDPVTREIAFKDVPGKQEIVKQMSKVKLDFNKEDL